MEQRSADEPRTFSEDDYPLQELTGRVIGAFFEVHRRFGFGFLESVYRQALAVELAYAGIPAAQQVPFELMHRGVSVGHYRADLIVASKLIVEAKTGLLFDPVAPAQLLNYLKAARLEVGLVLHFGPRTQIKRVIASRGRVEAL
jgi:GxxExxY protein